MQFTPIVGQEREKLLKALRENVTDNKPILMDRRDTSFAGSAETIADNEVISAIKSVPTHYGVK